MIKKRKYIEYELDPKNYFKNLGQYYVLIVGSILFFVIMLSHYKGSLKWWIAYDIVSFVCIVILGHYAASSFSRKEKKDT